MNYPVWDVPWLGSGLVVAIIAIVHILISHIAIGGGALLFVAEVWSQRQRDGERIRAWLHQYASFFLVYTTVFGAVTGVGIWFAIQLANPEATSLLIHQFVFAWATEWVAFLGELSVLYLYYYGWGHAPRRQQVFLAGAYFVIAWASLFIINGILTFMLTQGRWTLENQSVLFGFFNPGFVPSLLFRTVVMFLLAGLSGILVASRLDDDPDLKQRVVRFCACWAIPAGLLAPPLMLWYWSTLPASATELVRGGMAGVGGGRLEAITRNLWLAGTAGALTLLGVLVAAWRPRAVTTVGAVALLLAVQLGVAGAEFFREMARKPYVIHGVLYSNSLWRADAERLAAAGQSPYLERARFHPQPPALAAGHGEWVYRLQCAPCHTREGYRSMVARTRAWTPASSFAWLANLDAQGVMPPFQGTAADRAALVSYVLSLHGQQVSPAEVLAVAEPPARPTTPEGAP